MTYTFEELIEEKLSEFENATGMFLHKNRDLVKKELVDMCRNVKALTKRECSKALASIDNDYWWEEFFQRIDENTIEI